MQRMGVACPLGNPEQPPRGVDKIISILDKVPGSKKITFFTTGQVADENPELISKLSHNGHEIACHTYSHKYIHEFKDKEEFKKDILEAVKTLKMYSGQDIIGFRAPKFSINERSYAWAYEVLRECGFIYDCSTLRNEKRDIAKEYDHIETGKGIIYSFAQYYYLFKSFKIIGGTWFRILPLSLITKLMKKAFDDGYIPIVYLHPSDMDDKFSPVLMSEMKEVDFFRRIKWKFWQMRLLWKRKDTAKKLEALLKEFPNKGTLSESLPERI